jgi:hypothetical protein
MTISKIKFVSEGSDKYFKCGKYEFFVIRQGREGYALEVAEWYPLTDEYQVNKCFSRKVNIPYHQSAPIKDIKEKILTFLNQNPQEPPTWLK